MYQLLVVDDEITVCNGIKQIIDWKKYGFSVIDCCYDGKTAFEMAIEKRYDLIISDIRMPKLTGLELVKKLTQFNCCDNFIILSAYADFEYAQTAIRYGVKDYLLKPINEKKLTSIVIQICDSLKLSRQGENYIQKKYQDTMVCIGELKYLLLYGDVKQITMWFKNNLHRILSDSKGNTLSKEYTEFVLDKIFGLIGKQSTEFKDCDNNLEELVKRIESECRQAVLEREQSSKETGGKITIEDVLDYVNKNYNKDISLTQIAKEFYVNPVYLGRLFSVSVGKGFVDYLKDYRIDKALVLLRENKIMVYEICEQIGYKDLNYFYKVFKSSIGITPTEYRSRFINEENDNT